MPLRAKAIMRVARKKSRHLSRRILEAAPTRQVNYLRIYIIDGAYQRAELICAEPDSHHQLRIR
jgi:hypothetical protein